ncbi:unnamed protein product, partial [Meganyctiphanes norvegica]
LKIKDDDVMVVDNSTWNIKSQTSNNKENAPVHEITLERPGCFVEKSEKKTNVCRDKCLELSCIGLCCHMYQCSCLDTNNLCKHIHKVHSYRVKSFQVPRFKRPEVQEITDFDPSIEGHAIFHQTEAVEKESDKKVKGKNAEALKSLENISNHLRDENVVILGTSRIYNMIKETELACKSGSLKKNTEHYQFE